MSDIFESDSPPKKDPRRITGDEPSIEIPGRGEFFVYTENSRRDQLAHGAVYLIGAEAYRRFRKENMDIRSMDHETKRNTFKIASISSLSTGEGWDGLSISFMNNAGSSVENNKLPGTLDTIVSSDKKSPLLRGIVECIRGEVDKTESLQKESLRFNCSFVGQMSNPRELLKIIFSEFNRSEPKITPERNNSFWTEIPLYNND